MGDERELYTLKTIAETLNRSTNLQPMLQAVLEDLLSVTGLITGWIFLSTDKNKFTCEADVRLPTALAQNEKEPMCKGTCWCLNKYWDGRLNQAVNMIECKRLEDAVHFKTGDTEGLTHHATVPLTAAGESFGVLNVGSPGKESFSNDELTLLESVAFQIGTAIKRIQLYQDEQKRAENYLKLETLTRESWRHECADDLISAIVHRTGELFNWPLVGYFSKNKPNDVLHSIYKDGKRSVVNEAYSKESIQEMNEAVQNEKPVALKKNTFSLHPKPSIIHAIEVKVRDEHIGILFVFAESFSKSDREILRAVADHLALAIEQSRVNEKRQELILSEERNRLARDLHDSVSQKLFSLTMTARGAQNIPNTPTVLSGALQDMQQLSQEAMQEMRTLIWQLRPLGVEAGLMTSLKTYAIGLGLSPTCDISGFKLLPRPIEEALFRIGQESLNNIHKHAGVDEVSLYLQITEKEVCLTIFDKGSGFDQDAVGDFNLGLRGMNERVSLLGGTLSIDSKRKKGTKVQVRLPI